MADITGQSDSNVTKDGIVLLSWTVNVEVLAMVQDALM